jgi:hypothetical protein
VHGLTGVGRNQAETAVDRVAVGIDEPREKALAVQINALCVRGRRLHYLAQAAHREDCVAPNCHRLRVRILRVTGEDLGMKEDPLTGACLGP